MPAWSKHCGTRCSLTSRCQALNSLNDSSSDSIRFCSRCITTKALASWTGPAFSAARTSFCNSGSSASMARTSAMTLAPAGSALTMLAGRLAPSVVDAEGAEDSEALELFELLAGDVDDVLVAVLAIDNNSYVSVFA